MAKKQFTVVISGGGGYRTYRVMAEDWKDADRIADGQHRRLNPDDKSSEIGVAAVIRGWPEVW
ncbi:hypothetical protein F3J27_09160 [Enterobacter sp. Ap-916]|uniref:hypothetical protein n=1 Tax=unclassified Enterobacter TaxID=2608935 RepID=UPI001421C3A9|nr:MULTISPECIES: hypothetical protein [unclassified Enterobacter]NIF58935.1 hypothetical protein [Enterobacter sp. Ap-867]NIG29649.1 hypothetical protein [Enterobacter sp. Ap-916]